uniref:Leucine rich repeat containing 25 n=2 Tax=Nannospalax galili TaxID=1026970 RepID=A0A8C6W9T6_NANGA
CFSLLLLMVLLRTAGSQGLSCTVFSNNVDWSQWFHDTCLNFSGLGLRLPWNQSLQASSLRVLDLSANGLHQFPPAFFVNLQQLQTLIVTHNPLNSVDQWLAWRCDLELKADCSCALASWHKVRRDNCSGQQEPLCMHPASVSQQNLSTFLAISCPPGLAPGTIGAMVAGGVIFLILAIAGSVLAWRLKGHTQTNSQGLSKAAGSQDAPRPVSGFQLRYSSQSPGPKAQDTPSGRSTPDYENVFVGEPDKEHSWSAARAHLSKDSDFYMNYRGPSPDPQPVYCNLESLGR